MRKGSVWVVASFVAVLVIGASWSISAGAAGQGQAPGRGATPPAPLPPNPSTQEPAHKTTFEQVIKMETDLSNWGRRPARFGDAMAEAAGHRPARQRRVNDVQPSGVAGGTGEAANRPVHTLSIAIMGTPLVDNGYFEDAAQEAARLKRWDFFMTVQLTRIPGGTATTFNALGIF